MYIFSVFGVEYKLKVFASHQQSYLKNCARASKSLRSLFYVFVGLPPPSAASFARPETTTSLCTNISPPPPPPSTRQGALLRRYRARLAYRAHERHHGG